MGIATIFHIKKRNITLNELNKIIVKELSMKGAKIISNTIQEIYFEGGLQSLFNSKPYSNLLSVISKGNIEFFEIDSYIEIRYMMSFSAFISIGISIAALSFLTIFIMNGKIFYYIILAFWLLIIILLNIIVTMYRFRKYFKEILNDFLT